MGFKTPQLLFELEQHLHRLRHFSAVFGSLGKESITFHVSWFPRGTDGILCQTLLIMLHFVSTCLEYVMCHLSKYSKKKPKETDIVFWKILTVVMEDHIYFSIKKSTNKYSRSRRQFSIFFFHDACAVQVHLKFNKENVS